MNRHDQRRWLAEQAARLMHEHAIDDPMAALTRIVRRHGVSPDRRLWPDAEQIRAALRDYQSLFGGHLQASHVRHRREAAKAAMQFLAPFRPYLTGPVLDGTADAHSPVRLQLYCDMPDEVLRYLHEHGIPHCWGETHVQLAANLRSAVPKLSFVADDVAFELAVLPESSERQAPREADGHTPMPRANLMRLQAMLETREA
ncbi:MAG TPA: hypothetical protein VFN29_11970 [Chiayiivirga sp.]|nr:hypothetical protein [Chiayiivirga sp.]